MEYKNLELLQCKFSPPDDQEPVKRQIKFRHKMANLELASMMEKLENICLSIQEKNPSLIRHICKEVQRERPWGDPIDQLAVAKANKKGGQKSGRSAKSKGSVRTRTTNK